MRDRTTCKTCESDKVRTRGYCRQCWSAYVNDARNKSREKDPIKHLYHQLKSNAAQRKREFTITLEHFRMLVPEDRKCPVFGVEMVFQHGTNTLAPNSLTFDRIDSTKGYIPGNVVCISWRANVLKRDATVEEMEAVLAYMRAYSPITT